MPLMPPRRRPLPPRPDLGFRVFRLASSNFIPPAAAVPSNPDALDHHLAPSGSTIRTGRTELDILYELALKAGWPLSVRIRLLTLRGKTVYGVAGRLLVCLEPEVTPELISAMAALRPEQVICRECAFADDAFRLHTLKTFAEAGVYNFRTI